MGDAVSDEIVGSTPMHYDSYRPRFHVQPPAGWMNDPNGPVFYKGFYHIFYQHLPEACEWDFGIVWGHAVSSDLIKWRQLPPALAPSPGALDADGCFSGCCTVGEDGVPRILYTGVRMRSNQACGDLPPADQDLGMLWIETQMLAVPADLSDPLLVRWSKRPAAFLDLPPLQKKWTGWRDPYVYGHLGDRGVVAVQEIARASEGRGGDAAARAAELVELGEDGVPIAAKANVEKAGERGDSEAAHAQRAAPSALTAQPSTSTSTSTSTSPPLLLSPSSSLLRITEPASGSADGAAFPTAPPPSSALSRPGQGLSSEGPPPPSSSPLPSFPPPPPPALPSGAPAATSSAGRGAPVPSPLPSPSLSPRPAPPPSRASLASRSPPAPALPSPSPEASSLALAGVAAASEHHAREVARGLPGNRGLSRASMRSGAGAGAGASPRPFPPFLDAVMGGNEADLPAPLGEVPVASSAGDDAAARAADRQTPLSLLSLAPEGSATSSGQPMGLGGGEGPRPPTLRRASTNVDAYAQALGRAREASLARPSSRLASPSARDGPGPSLGEGASPAAPRAASPASQRSYSPPDFRRGLSTIFDDANALFAPHGTHADSARGSARPGAGREGPGFRGPAADDEARAAGADSEGAPAGGSTAAAKDEREEKREFGAQGEGLGAAQGEGGRGRGPEPRAVDAPLAATGLPNGVVHPTASPTLPFRPPPPASRSSPPPPSSLVAPPPARGPDGAAEGGGVGPGGVGPGGVVPDGAAEGSVVPGGGGGVSESSLLPPPNPPARLSTTFTSFPVPPVSLPPAPPEAAYSFSPDPAVVASSRRYRMLIGSGIDGVGGAALVYASDALDGGWELLGELCSGLFRETGKVWECPLLLQMDRIDEVPHEVADGEAEAEAETEREKRTEKSTSDDDDGAAIAGDGAKAIGSAPAAGQAEDVDAAATSRDDRTWGEERDASASGPSSTSSGLPGVGTDAPAAAASARAGGRFQGIPTWLGSTFSEEGRRVVADRQAKQERAVDAKTTGTQTETETGIEAGERLAGFAPPAGTRAVDTARSSPGRFPCPPRPSPFDAPGDAKRAATSGPGDAEGAESALPGAAGAPAETGAAAGTAPGADFGAPAAPRSPRSQDDDALSVRPAHSSLAISAPSALLSLATPSFALAAAARSPLDPLSESACADDRTTVLGPLAGVEDSVQRESQLERRIQSAEAPGRGNSETRGCETGSGGRREGGGTTPTEPHPGGGCDHEGGCGGTGTSCHAASRADASRALLGSDSKSDLLAAPPPGSAAAQAAAPSAVSSAARLATPKTHAATPTSTSASASASSSTSARVPATSSSSPACSSFGLAPCGPSRHLFTVSPDAPTNPVLYWLGPLLPDGWRFDIANADGPFLLDLGDVVYAPNCLRDVSQNRWLVWGWIQERRKAGSYDYAGCLSVPRELGIGPDDRLIQAPARELLEARRGQPARARDVPLWPRRAVPLDAFVRVPEGYDAKKRAKSGGNYGDARGSDADDASDASDDDVYASLREAYGTLEAAGVDTAKARRLRSSQSRRGIPRREPGDCATEGVALSPYGAVREAGGEVTGEVAGDDPAARSQDVQQGSQPSASVAPRRRRRLAALGSGAASSSRRGRHRRALPRLPPLQGAALDLELTVSRHQSSAFGISLASYEAGDDASAAVVFAWRDGSLYVHLGAPEDWMEWYEPEEGEDLEGDWRWQPAKFAGFPDATEGGPIGPVIPGAEERLGKEESDEGRTALEAVQVSAEEKGEDSQRSLEKNRNEDGRGLDEEEAQRERRDLAKPQEPQSAIKPLDSSADLSAFPSAPRSPSPPSEPLPTSPSASTLSTATGTTGSAAPTAAPTTASIPSSAAAAAAAAAPPLPVAPLGATRTRVGGFPAEGGPSAAAVPAGSRAAAASGSSAAPPAPQERARRAPSGGLSHALAAAAAVGGTAPGGALGMPKMVSAPTLSSTHPLPSAPPPPPEPLAPPPPSGVRGASPSAVSASAVSARQSPFESPSPPPGHRRLPASLRETLSTLDLGAFGGGEEGGGLVGAETGAAAPLRGEDRPAPLRGAESLLTGAANPPPPPSYLGGGLRARMAHSLATRRLEVLRRAGIVPAHALGMLSGSLAAGRLQSPPSASFSRGPGSAQGGTPLFGAGATRSLAFDREHAATVAASAPHGGDPLAMLSRRSSVGSLAALGGPFGVPHAGDLQSGGLVRRSSASEMFFRPSEAFLGSGRGGGGGGGGGSLGGGGFGGFGGSVGGSLHRYGPGPTLSEQGLVRRASLGSFMGPGAPGGSGGPGTPLGGPGSQGSGSLAGSGTGRLRRAGGSSARGGGLVRSTSDIHSMVWRPGGAGGAAFSGATTPTGGPAFSGATTPTGGPAFYGATTPVAGAPGAPAASFGSSDAGAMAAPGSSPSTSSSAAVAAAATRPLSPPHRFPASLPGGSLMSSATAAFRGIVRGAAEGVHEAAHGVVRGVHEAREALHAGAEVGRALEGSVEAAVEAPAEALAFASPEPPEPSPLPGAGLLGHVEGAQNALLSPRLASWTEARNEAQAHFQAFEEGRPLLASDPTAASSTAGGPRSGAQTPQAPDPLYAGLFSPRTAALASATFGRTRRAIRERKARTRRAAEGAAAGAAGVGAAGAAGTLAGAAGATAAGEVATSGSDATAAGRSDASGSAAADDARRLETTAALPPARVADDDDDENDDDDDDDEYDEGGLDSDDDLEDDDDDDDDDDDELGETSTALLTLDLDDDLGTVDDGDDDDGSALAGSLPRGASPSLGGLRSPLRRTVGDSGSSRLAVEGLEGRGGDAVAAPCAAAASAGVPLSPASLGLPSLPRVRPRPGQGIEAGGAGGGFGGRLGGALPASSAPTGPDHVSAPAPGLPPLDSAPASSLPPLALGALSRSSTPLGRPWTSTTDLQPPSPLPAPSSARSPALPRSWSFLGAPGGSSSTPSGVAGAGVLENLLDDLSAPMRELAPPTLGPERSADLRDGGAGDEAPGPGGASAASFPGTKRVGGRLAIGPRDTLRLRIFIDHSCVEIFSGTGEVLTTRVYRGAPPAGGGTGIAFVSFGQGPAILESAAAWEVESAWHGATPAALSQATAAANAANASHNANRDASSGPEPLSSGEPSGALETSPISPIGSPALSPVQLRRNGSPSLQSPLQPSTPTRASPRHAGPQTQAELAHAAGTPLAGGAAVFSGAATPRTPLGTFAPGGEAAGGARASADARAAAQADALLADLVGGAFGM